MRHALQEFNMCTPFPAAQYFFLVAVKENCVFVFFSSAGFCLITNHRDCRMIPSRQARKQFEVKSSFDCIWNLLCVRFRPADDVSLHTSHIRV
jgi:hypothetical protein